MTRLIVVVLDLLLMVTIAKQPCVVSLETCGEREREKRKEKLYIEDDSNGSLEIVNESIE